MAHAHEPDLTRKLDQLTDRVALIEQKLGLSPAPPPEAAPPVEQHEAKPDIASESASPLARKAEILRGITSPPPEPSKSLAAPTQRPHRPQPPAPPPVAPPPVVPKHAAPTAPSTPSKVEEAIAALRSAPTTSTSAPASKPIAAPPAARSATPPAPPAPPPHVVTDKPHRSVEFAIGTSWFAWVGAIVLLLAGALFITTAYREGWIGEIPPVTRCISVAVFGVLLLGAGEWALRKISRAAAVGFYGAGLGTLYLDAFATSQWFKIAPESTAFILLSLVALVGFVLTLRARTLTIGVLSVVGGYLAPILLSGIATNPAGSAVYLSMLLAIALGLSAFLPKPMRALRYVAVSAHGLLALLWAADAVPGHWLVALVAFTVWWMMIAGESLFAALREQSPTGNVVITLLASAWYVLIGIAILNSTPAVGFDWLGAYTFAVAALSIAVAMTFGPGLDALRAKPRSAMDKLALALLLQGGALLIVAVALQFDGYARAIAWLAIGLTAIETGRRLPSRGLDIFGLITGALGVAVVVLVESWTTTALRTTLFEMPGVEVTGWTLLALFALIAIFIAGKRLRHAEGSAWNGMKITLIVFALLGWMGLWSIESWSFATTWLWLGAAAGLILLERFGRREMFFEIGVAALAVTGARWLLVDAVGWRLSSDWDATAVLPIFNWQMALAVAIAGCAGAASLIARRRPSALPQLAQGSAAQQRNATAIVLATIGFAAFMLFALSFEIDRIATRISLTAGEHAWSLNQIRNLLLTALWASGSVVVHIFASSLKKRGGAPGQAAGTIMRVTWISMILLTGKWMIVDTLLFGVLTPSTTRYDLLPVLNVQMITAIVVAGGAVLMLSLMKRAARDAAQGGAAGAELSPFDRAIAGIVPVLASIFVLWALSFEVERFIGRLVDAGTTFNWHEDHVRLMALTMLWSAGSAAIALLGRWRRAEQLVSSGALIAIMAGVFWLTVDTLQWRLQGPPTSTTLVLNMQFISGVIAALSILVAVRTLRPFALSASTHRGLVIVGWSVIALIALWLGSLEIDRVFVSAAATLSPGQVTARQMCLSVYWALYAFALIAAGFRMPSAPVRYAGIALFGLTLVKVFLVDLSQVDSIYRIASLLAVGLLLVLTSAAYAKLAPRLLASERNAKSTHLT